MEAELIMLSYKAREAIYLSNLLHEIGFEINLGPSPSPLTQTTLERATTDRVQKNCSRTNYITKRHQMLKELVKDGRINVCYKGATNMMAYVCTKHLKKQAFENGLMQIQTF